jgi:hypothetical protein
MDYEIAAIARSLESQSRKITLAYQGSLFRWNEPHVTLAACSYQHQ